MYVPFLATFGVLGLIVGVVIVGNVVSGAVVSGFRHIGILKALGFTPRQVVAVYLVDGVGAGRRRLRPRHRRRRARRPTAADARASRVSGSTSASASARGSGSPGWSGCRRSSPSPRSCRPSGRAACRRPRRSAPAAHPGIGRGTRIQHRLAGARLPRAVTLGLGLPFARPGRTAFTVAAVLLGVTTVTFATGLADTLVRISTIEDTAAGQIGVQPSNGLFRLAPSDGRAAGRGAGHHHPHRRAGRGAAARACRTRPG